MILKLGDHGEKVKRLKRALNGFGFNLNEDGFFDGATDTAVREFQKDNGLVVNGSAGSSTLSALGLDPDTLEELSDGDGDVNVIVFNEDEAAVDVPPVVRNKISTFVELVARQHDKLLMSLLNALAQFETTMSFASGQDADPDLLGTLVSRGFQMAVEELVSRVPGLSQAKAFFDVTTEELERAGRASQSLNLGDWIKDQRAAIDAWMEAGVSNENRDLLQADLESDYLDQDELGRQEFFERLNQAINQPSGDTGNRLDELEAAFYVQWINAHFTQVGGESGYIEYRLEYDDNDFDFESCTVKAPFGDKIDSALNHLLDRGQLPDTWRPIDFKVHKRVLLNVENLVGGQSWFAGWLNEENEIIDEPILSSAQEGLRDNEWRISVDRFKS